MKFFNSLGRVLICGVILLAALVSFSFTMDFAKVLLNMNAALWSKPVIPVIMGLASASLTVAVYWLLLKALPSPKTSRADLVALSAMLLDYWEEEDEDARSEGFLDAEDREFRIARGLRPDDPIPGYDAPPEVVYPVGLKEDIDAAQSKLAPSTFGGASVPRSIITGNGGMPFRESLAADAGKVHH